MAGRQRVNADCSRLAPTKAVSQSQRMSAYTARLRQDAKIDVKC